MPPIGANAKASTARGGGRGRRRGGHGAEEHENTERWLVTYADMLTVMLALFIVLFAISALNESKFQQLKYSLAAVFGDGSIGVLDGSPALNDASNNHLAQPPTMPDVPVTTDPVVPAVPNLGGWLAGDHGVDSGSKGTDDEVANTQPPAPGLLVNTGSKELNAAIKVELRNFQQIERDINAALDKAGMPGAVEFSIDERGLIVTVVTNALVFPGNSATLLPRGQKLLAAIAPAIRKVPNNVEVDGFTNQVDVSTYPYPSGWELSSARASAVVRYLESHGLNNRLLSAVGFSDQKPLVPPDDPRSVTRNRRVEIVVLSSLPSVAGGALAEAAHATETAPGPQAVRGTDPTPDAAAPAPPAPAPPAPAPAAPAPAAPAPAAPAEAAATPAPTAPAGTASAGTASAAGGTR